MSAAGQAGGGPAAALPELASVHWRPRASEHTLRRRARLWTGWTALHLVTFLVTAVALVAVEPWLFPMSLACLAYAWVLLELYAARAANTLRPKRRAGAPGERMAQGLLGDLLGHEERELQRETGLALERGDLGVWLVAERGAALIVPRGGRVHCFCVAPTDPELPPSDRIAHLLLALRTDERGFATVANHAFSGAPWRLRRRLAPGIRPALDAARAAAAGPA
jgi:hypothetical protein